MSPEDDTLTIVEAAQELGLETAEVYRLVFEKLLPSVEASNGRRLVPRQAVEEYHRQRVGRA